MKGIHSPGGFQPFGFATTSAVTDVSALGTSNMKSELMLRKKSNYSLPKISFIWDVSRVFLRFGWGRELFDTFPVPIFEAGGAEFDFASVIVRIF